MIVKTLLSMFTLVGCFANDFEEPKQLDIDFEEPKKFEIDFKEEFKQLDAAIECDFIANCYAEAPTLPIKEYESSKKQIHKYKYENFLPNFTLAFALKNAIWGKGFQYTMLTTCTHITYGTNFLQLFAHQGTYGNDNCFRGITICPDKKSAILKAQSTYRSCLQFFDLIGFNYCVDVSPLALLISAGVTLGYSNHDYEMLLKNENVGTVKVSCCIYDKHSPSGNSEHIMPVNDRYNVIYCDKMSFFGIPLTVKYMIDENPFSIECTSKVCPYIGYMKNECHIEGILDLENNKHYSDIPMNNYHCSVDSWNSTYPGAIVELSCKCFWNIPLEDYDIQLGVGYRKFLLYFISCTGIPKYEDSFDTIAQMYNNLESVAYEGFSASISVGL